MGKSPNGTNTMAMRCEGGAFILALLDFAVAFDSISYDILPEWLLGLGTKGTVLSWCISSLRPFSVNIDQGREI